MTTLKLDRLAAGMLVPFGGDQAAVVSAELAASFEAGDRLVVMQDTGDLLRVPADLQWLVAAAVDAAVQAFEVLRATSDEDISLFFDRFADQLEDQGVWGGILAANDQDVARARGLGRSTTRLEVSESMRVAMVVGLRAWRDMASPRGATLQAVDHAGWRVEQVLSPLGVVGFVFEGRPNVFADAVGVLRTGNTAVLRIGSDALGTAQAIVRGALWPALDAARLPRGAVSLLETPDRAAGWALFSDTRLGLAVARGSGRAVAQLGGVARQSGIAVSLHGTGGAWLIADHDADLNRFSASVFNSLDRKVCNTLNVCCIHRDRLDDLLPAFLESLEAAGAARGHNCKLHVVDGDVAVIPPAWRDRTVRVRRADGDHDELQVELLPVDALGREWEWEDTPEVSLKIIDHLDEAIDLLNRFSPRFTVSLIAANPQTHQRFWDAADAPFVGDGFTRWADGQFALDQPELGLSNWEGGRLLARSAILSGGSIYTVRSRARQTDLDLRR